MKRVYLMCGLPYAGKTTLARAIAARTGAAVVSLDDINAERGLHGAGDLPVAEWAETHRLALERTAALMREGRAVVVDDTHCYRWLRDDHRRQAAEHGYATQVVLLDVPFADCMDRAREGGRARDLEVGMLFRIAQEFEAPTLDERALVYDGAQPPAAWAEENLAVE
jgi:predicted kinase